MACRFRACNLPDALMISAKHMSSQVSPSMAFYQAVAWLEANKKLLLVAFIVVVMVGFGIAAYFWQSDRTERAANDALLRLKTTARGPETPAPNAAAYLQIVDEYRGTKAAARALLFAASALFAENNYADAQTHFERFLREHPQSPLAATAAYGAAAALEAQTRTDEAAAGYQNIPVRYPNSTLTDDAKMSMARIYESKGQPAQALRIYDELIKPTGQRGPATEAMMRREYLLVRHPALTQTNAPAVNQTSQVELPATAEIEGQALTATTNTAAQP
jgi:outer membrane protein assembly factor BamD (BamD/ComL family)